MANPTELQGSNQDYGMRSNDGDVRKLLGNVVSRESFALNCISLLISTSQTLDYRYSVFRFDTSGGGVTATLPSCGTWTNDQGRTSSKSGVMYLINHTGSNNVTVTTSNSELIEGAATYVLYPGQRIAIVSMGSVLGGWKIIDSTSLSIAWTPTVSGLTTAGTGTYTASRTGNYQFVGIRAVAINMTVVWTAHTGTGQISISGLPFTFLTGQLQPITMLCTLPGMALGDKTVGLVMGGTSRIDVYYENTGAIGAVNLGATGTMRLTGTVMID